SGGRRGSAPSHRLADRGTRAGKRAPAQRVAAPGEERSPGDFNAVVAGAASGDGAGSEGAAGQDPGRGRIAPARPSPPFAPERRYAREPVRLSARPVPEPVPDAGARSGRPDPA